MSKQQTEELAGRVDKLLGDALRSAKGGDRAGVETALKEARSLGVNKDNFMTMLKQYDSNKEDWGWFRSFAQGLSLGFADEAEAYIRSLTGEDYDKTLRNLRAGKAAYEGEYPVRATAAEIAGGVGTLAMPMGLPAKIVGGTAKAAFPALRGAQTVARTPSTIGTAVRSGATGLTEGAVYGYGTGEGGVANRTQSAIESGAISALGGTAVPLIAGAGQTAIRQFGKSPEELVSQRIASAIGAQRIPEVSQRVAQRAAVGDVRPETLADISGEAAQRAVRGARVAVPDFGQEVGEMLGERTMGARGRVLGDVGEAAQSSLGIRFDEALDPDAIASAQSDAADAMYGALRREYDSVRTDDFMGFLKSPAVRDNYKEAADELLNRQAMGELDASDVANMPKSYDEMIDFLESNKNATAPFAFFETLVRKIGDDINSAKRAGKASRASSLSKFKERLVGKMDEKFVGNAEAGVPSFKEARSVFADSAVVLEAFEKGSKFTKMSPAQINKFVADATESERQAFGQAAIQSLGEKYGRETGNIARNISTDANMKSRLAALTGGEDSQSYKTLMDALNRESEMGASAQRITGNSTTAEKLVDESMLGEVEGIRRRAENVGYVGAIGERVADELLRPITATDVGVRTGRALMTTDPIQQQMLMSGVRQVAPAQARREFVTKASGVAGRGLGLGTSMAQDKPVTIYTDEQMRSMGMGGLLQ
jgi:hypothetical protein